MLQIKEGNDLSFINSKNMLFFSVQGASVDPRDKLRRTPLFLAAGEGATESVQALLDGGADVTLKDVDMQSCVRMAVEHTETMEVILQV